jgi:hypothetical protein
MGYWRLSARNTVIREMMKVGEKGILERIEQKQLQWYGHVKRMENDKSSENHYGVGNRRQEKESQTLGDKDRWC